MIEGLFHHGALPTLERFVQFTGQRHRVLTHNVANMDTPFFRPVDLNPKAFQETLREAIDERRKRPMPLDGPLDLDDTRQLRFSEDGVETRPGFRDQNILFHDRNNRDLERLMQDVAENTLAHNAGVEMLRNQFEMLKMAIRERIT